jgi:hypothetical protein
MNAIDVFDQVVRDNPTAKLSDLLRLVRLPVTVNEDYRKHILKFAIDNGRRLWPGGSDFKTLAKLAIDAFEAALAARPAAEPMPDKGKQLPGAGAVGGVEGESALRLPELVDAGDAMTKKYDPPKWILENFFRMGTKGALIAISKGWKTWLMMQLGVCVATGLRFLEYETPARRKVLFFNTELPEDEFARRLRLMSAGLGVSADDLRGQFKALNCSGYDVDVTNIQEAVNRIIDGGFHPEVILIDPLFCLYPLHERFDENSNADMIKLLRTFDTITLDTGAAVMFSHHFAKNRGDGINVGAGAGAINRSYRSALIMTEHETDEDYAVIESRGNFQGRLPPFTIRFHDGFFVTAPEVEPIAKGLYLKVKAEARKQLLPVTDVAATLAEEITGRKAVDFLVADMESRFDFKERRARTVINVLLSEHGFIRTGGGAGRGPSMIGPA